MDIKKRFRKYYLKIMKTIGKGTYGYILFMFFYHA